MAEAKSGKKKDKKDKDKKDDKKRGLADILRDPNSNYESPGYRDAKALGTKQFETNTRDQARERTQDQLRRERARFSSGQSLSQSSRPIYDPDASDPSKVRPTTYAGGGAPSGGGGGTLGKQSLPIDQGKIDALIAEGKNRAKVRGDRIRASRGKPQSQGRGGKGRGGMGGGGGSGGFESILRILGAMYANRQAPLQMLNTPGTALNLYAQNPYTPSGGPKPRSLNELRGL